MPGRRRGSTGLSDSEAIFDAYDDHAAASDALALTEQLGDPAVLIGNSMGATISNSTAEILPRRGAAQAGPPRSAEPPAPPAPPALSPR